MGDGAGEDAGLGFRPVNDLERVLARCVLTGARATLLRALARSTVCVGAHPASRSDPDGSEPRVPCVTDGHGRHALVYTSYRQLELAGVGCGGASWLEVPVATLFEKWPPDVDVWLNAGGELGFPLDHTDVIAIADLAAGLATEEAYELGPDDEFTDFPGPAVPDQVDCAVILALFDVPHVVEVLRSFRRLEEPDGRTWRILLVLVDGGAGTEELAQSVAGAVNEAADECCEVHVADLHDDEVYDAVAHLLDVGVPLWRRQGFPVPDTLADLDPLGGPEAPPDRDRGEPPPG